nr:PREDICTED: mucin-5AC-like [Tribolium castaneum]|eukprot:XP_008195610.1 PREDICTED: mucin-5AC-like [Tribolium castaneum]
MTHETPPKTSPFPTKIKEATSTILEHSQSVPPQQSNELLTSFRFANKISRDLEGVSKEQSSSTISTQKTTETPCLPTKIDETMTSEENTSLPMEENDLSESFQLLNKTFLQLESAFENLTSGNAKTSGVQGGTAKEVRRTTTEVEKTSANYEVSETTSEIATFSAVSEIIVPIIEVTETSSTSSTPAETAELTLQTSSSPVAEVSSTAENTSEETTVLMSEKTTNFAFETTLETSRETEMTSSVISSSKLTPSTSSTKEAYAEENLAQFTKPIPTSVLKMEGATNSTFSLIAIPETSASTETETIIFKTGSSTNSPPELEETSPQTTSFNIATEKQMLESKESPTVSSTIKEEFAHFTKPVPTSLLKQEGGTVTTYSSIATPETSASTETETIIMTTGSTTYSPPQLEETSPQTTSFNIATENQMPESKESPTVSSTTKEEYAEENFVHFTKPVPASVLNMEGGIVSTYSSIATPETSASAETETIIVTTSSATYSPPEIEETSPQTTLFNIATEKQMPESEESPTVSSTTKEEYAEENFEHFAKPVPTSVLKMEEITTNEYFSIANEVPIISATPIEDVKLTSLAKILFPPYIHIPTYKTDEVEDNVPKEINPLVTFSTTELQNGPTIYAPYAQIPTYRTNQFQEVSSPPFPPQFTPLPSTSNSLTTSSQNLEDVSNEYAHYRDEELSAILNLLGHDSSTVSTDNDTCGGMLGKIKRKVFTVKNLLLKSKNRQKEHGIRRKKDVHLRNDLRPKRKRVPDSKEKRMKQVERLGKMLQWRNMEFRKQKSAKNRKKRRK